MSTEYPPLDLQSIPSTVLSADEHLFFAKISPQIAEKIIEDCNYLDNRPINQRRIIELSSFMLDGSFHPLTATLKFSVENNEAILTDGQHRLTAMTKSNKTYAFPILVTKQPAKKMYPIIDRGGPRSLRDAIKSGGIAHILNTSDAIAIKSAVALKVITSGYVISGSYKSPINESVLLNTLTSEYKKEVNRVFEMLDHLELAIKLGGRLPLSMFLALYKNLPSEDYCKVDEFIYGIGSNIGLGEGDTRRFIYSMYANSRRKGGSIGRGGRILSSLEEMSTLLICWKYWYENKSYSRRFSEAQRLKCFRQTPNLSGTNISYVGSSPRTD